jgi:hypothetical protein
MLKSRPKILSLSEILQHCLSIDVLSQSRNEVDGFFRNDLMSGIFTRDLFFRHGFGVLF